MKKIHALCSMCALFLSLLLMPILSHADTAWQHTDLGANMVARAPVKTKSVSELPKLASVYWILAKDKTNFTALNFNARFTDEESGEACTLNNVSLPSHCAEATSSCKKNGVTYYSTTCANCSSGYTVQDGACVWQCQGYVENDNISGCREDGYATCNAAQTIYYRCNNCREGWESDGDGGCAPKTCDEDDYPYHSSDPSWRPTVCKTVTNPPCYAGDDTYYGCTECYSPGYIKSKGLCAAIECGSGYEDSCPANGVCETCQSGSQTKHRLTGCQPTYELNASGTGCEKAGALAFTVTTTAENQSITIKTTGDVMVDWGDDKVLHTSGTNKSTTHTYATAGSYDVYVTGTPTYAAVTSGQTYITQLLDISLPSITSYQATFKKASNMQGDLTNMEFPSGLTNGDSMFYGCSKITGSIPELPTGLTNGASMFYGCKEITGSIPELPTGLTNGSYMFGGCFGLTGSIPELPSGITDGSFMFSGCSGLTGSIPELPSSLTSGNYMFSYCSGITGSIPELPTGLTNGSYMFQNCSGLTGSIPRLPAGLTSGGYMFDGCSGLTGTIIENNPTLPTGLTSGNYMFRSCSGLTGTIPTLPSSLTSGSEMFRSCSGLTGTIPTLPSGLTDGTRMFQNCSGLTGSIPELPSGLISGKYMFSGCSGLTGNIPELPSGLTNGQNMFNGCSGLTGSIPELPSGLTDGSYMFQNCSGLTGSIPVLPTSLTRGSYMFYGCRRLSGNCPPKPDSLTSFNWMYQNTKVCCDYGNGKAMSACTCDRSVYKYDTSQWTCYVEGTGEGGQCGYCTEGGVTYMSVTCNGNYVPYPDASMVGCVSAEESTCSSEGRPFSDSGTTPYNMDDWDHLGAGTGDCCEYNGYQYCRYTQCYDGYDLVNGFCLAAGESTCSPEGRPFSDSGTTSYNMDDWYHLGAGTGDCCEYNGYQYCRYTQCYDGYDLVNGVCLACSETTGWIDRDVFYVSNPSIGTHCTGIKWCEGNSRYLKCTGCDAGYTLTNNPEHVCEAQ